MNKLIKRLLDLILALMLFIPAALVLLFGVLFVRIVSPESSPIFKQERVGFKGKLFTLFKLLLKPGPVIKPCGSISVGKVIQIPL